MIFRFINIKTATLMCFVLMSGSVGRAEAGALGGLFVEPAVTYEIGSTRVNYPSPFSDSTGTANGLGVAGRFGVHVSSIIFLGVDARYAMTTFKDSSVSYDAAATTYAWGPFVGVQMPTLVALRAWGSYIWGSELNPEASGSLNVKFNKGTGYRLGAGFRVSIVSLNLEYQDLSYAETALEQIGPFSTNTTFNGVSLRNKSLIASVSFPLDL